MLFAVDSMRDRDRTVFAATVEQARRAYTERLRATFEQSAELVEKPVVRLSPEASEMYEAEEQRLRLLIDAAESVGDGFASHVAKHPAMLARVALTFHAISTYGHPCSGNVTAESMRLASRFMRRAYQHAHAIYSDCLAIGAPLELAKAIARSMLADEADSFNRREMTHACRAFRDATEWQRLAALRVLEDYAWIEGETFLPEHGGRWTINPRVHRLYAAERDAARARRKAVALAIIGGVD